MMSDNKYIPGIVTFIVACLLIGVLMAAIYTRPEKVSPNEQTLNAYATFENRCHYRGYDRSECLQIWSGR